VSEWSYMCIC